MTVNDLATHDVRDQFSAYVDPRNKDIRDYHQHEANFDAWLEKIKAEAEAKGREKAFQEVYATLEGQERFLTPMVAEDVAQGKTGYINESFIDGINHALGAIKSARHLAELPEALTAVAFAALDGKK
jgi:uncharacterized protein (DUF2267 family)